MDNKTIIDIIIEYLNKSATIIPLELFIFIGSLIEEIVAPIPSPFVTTLAGSIAATHSYPLIMILILAMIGSAGKTSASIIIYKIADIGEDILVSKCGKLLGLSHDSIEKYGKKLGQSKHNWIILTSLRAFPAMPSAPISAVCGLIKMPLLGYLTATFIGNIIRNAVYLYIGYSGINMYQDMFKGIDTLESVMKMIILTMLISAVAWFYWKRRISAQNEQQKINEYKDIRK